MGQVSTPQVGSCTGYFGLFFPASSLHLEATPPLPFLSSWAQAPLNAPNPDFSTSLSFSVAGIMPDRPLLLAPRENPQLEWQD